MNIKIILYVLFFLLLSCGSDTLSPEEFAAQEASKSPNPKILLSMSEGLKLTLSIDKIVDKISFLTLTITYDSDVLEAISYEKGSFGTPWANMDYMDVNSDTINCSFSFSTDISGSGDLITINFSGNESNYKNTRIFPALRLEDNSGNMIDISRDSDFIIQEICYIDDGIISQAFENSTEPMSDWEPSGNFVWSNAFCSYGQ
tara:strand:+ start:1296 stop:1901 length:606 start_codon:yes stop_codon:yes gene_type:complete